MVVGTLSTGEISFFVFVFCLLPAYDVHLTVSVSEPACRTFLFFVGG